MSSRRASVFCSSLLAVVAAAGCAGPEAELAVFEVTDASLSNVDLGHAAAIVGIMSGTATLHFTDSDGQAHSHAVTLEGPLLGAAISAQGQDSWGFDPPDGSLVLPGPITADQLFGVYQGSATGAALVIGINEHDLENGAGVKLTTDYLTAGIGIVGAIEWLCLSLADGQ